MHSPLHLRGLQCFMVALLVVVAGVISDAGARTLKPPLHGRHWMAITGKPLAATAGSIIFQKGGNAVDAACAMIAASATVWDTLSWGGETQALIYNPKTGKVIAINALGVAPTGSTPEFYRAKGLIRPPEFGPLAAITPGTPGGIITMLAEFGTMSLAEVLQPSLELAEGFPVERQLAETIQHEKAWLMQWPESRRALLVHEGSAWEAPRPGEIFRQPDLAATLKKLIEAERRALAAGKSRKAALYAAYDRFYKGDIGREFVRGARELGGLVTTEDLAAWRVHVEDAVHTSYRGVDVYKLNTSVQGPALLQALNILENFDVESMGYNSTPYIHTLYQAMSLAFADRDFYYGDPYVPPEEPIRGLLSKDYARERAKLVRADRNDPDIAPGDPYPSQAEKNPFSELLESWQRRGEPMPKAQRSSQDRGALFANVGEQPGSPRVVPAEFERAFYAGTTSVVSADADGWTVAVTPSGGWIPAVIAGRTGMGMSQRAQAFVLDAAENPFNVMQPGKRPRATPSPTLVLRNGKPLLAMAVQGGDAQEQDQLQFLLNVLEFDMAPQEAAEAANFNSFQLRESFDAHESTPGRLLLNNSTPMNVRRDLGRMGYELAFRSITTGPINAIYFDQQYGTLWGGSNFHGEDYGIAW